MSAELKQQAVSMVMAQAGVRPMSAAEIGVMIDEVYKVLCGDTSTETTLEYKTDPKNAIREKSVVCCVCGESFKLLTKRHLASHNMTQAEYREWCGYKKNTPLVAKALQKQRREKMKGMELWKRRGQSKDVVEPKAVDSKKLAAPTTPPKTSADPVKAPKVETPKQ